MNRSAVSLLALSLSLAALPGCGSDPVTQLVVVVDTDLMVPDEINQFRIGTYRAGADVVEQFDYGIYQLDASSMPFKLGILVPEALQPPEGMEPEEPLRVAIEVVATGPSDRDRVMTRVEAEYVEGLSLEIPINVAGVCRRTMCPMGWSCGQDGCVPIAELTPEQVPYMDEDLETLETLPPTPTTEE